MTSKSKKYPTQNVSYNIRESIQKNSFHGLVIQVLEKEGKTMKRTDILDKVLSKKKTKGKTPEKTINSILKRSNHITRVKEGYYKLKR